MCAKSMVKNNLNLNFSFAPNRIILECVRIWKLRQFHIEYLVTSVSVCLF